MIVIQTNVVLKKGERIIISSFGGKAVQQPAIVIHQTNVSEYIKSCQEISVEPHISCQYFYKVSTD